MVTSIGNTDQAVELELDPQKAWKTFLESADSCGWVPLEVNHVPPIPVQWNATGPGLRYDGSFGVDRTGSTGPLRDQFTVLNVGVEVEPLEVHALEMVDCNKIVFEPGEGI